MTEEALIMLHWSLWANDRNVASYELWKKDYLKDKNEKNSK